jgi:hypothetical protein
MKKPALILLILILLTAGNITAQLPSRQHYWIFLKDKEQTIGVSANPGQLGISERALKRRAKVLPPGRIIDQSDIPVPESVINEIRQTGVKIRSISRWFNAVSVEGRQNRF